MPAAPFRSTARWILIVGALLALIPGIIPEVRTNGVLEFAHHWIWTAFIAAVVLAPYAAVFILSSPTRSDASRQLARGIALLTSVAAFVALSLSLLLALYGLFFGAPTLLRLQIASMILLIAMNAWMLWSALRGAGKAEPRVLVGAAAAFVFVSVATRLVVRVEAAAASGVQNHQHDLYAAERQANEALRQLAVCASTYRMSHGPTLPQTLPALVSAAGCDAGLASPSAAPMYLITLDVNPADTVAPGATMGCQFTAKFTGKLLGQRAQRPDGRTLWSTCSGGLYAHELAQPLGAYMRISDGFPTEAIVLFRNVLLTSYESGGRFPAALGELLAAKHLENRRNIYDANVLRAQQRADLDSNIFRTAGYLVRYVASAHDFHLDLRCETHGPECMRSYLVEASGMVYGTGEPRPARAADPRIEGCELRNVRCDGTPDSLWVPPVVPDSR